MKRKICYELLAQLFTYSDKDYCFDPLGSFDAGGIFAAIERTSRGEVTPSIVSTGKLFSRKAMKVNRAVLLTPKSKLYSE